jgi:peptide-methionine (S)-S-oxide reductase
MRVILRPVILGALVLVLAHASSAEQPRDVATLSGGCFWAMQAMFTQLKGVDSVEAGYAGGHTPNPTYEQVCRENTGYAETIQISFDPRVISYRDLLTIFFSVHDPTTPDRQGDDVGSSYRSAIFYHDAKQEEIARQVIRRITDQRLWPNPIITQVVPYTSFYRAESYHQNYYAHNPDTEYCRYVVAPKVAKFRAHFLARLK